MVGGENIMIKARVMEGMEMKTKEKQNFTNKSITHKLSRASARRWELEYFISET